MDGVVVAGRTEETRGVAERIRLALASDSVELPMLPETATRVVALCRSDDVEVRQLADLLRSDPGLSAKILALVNSALYAPVAPIVSVQHAMSRLGFSRVAELALAHACRSRLFRVPGHEARLREFFRRAVAAAAMAREIARVRRENVEEAFVAGLFHDLGRPLVLQIHADLGAPLGDEADLEGLLDELHAEAGERLVASWGMPARLVRAVRWHHQPDEAGEEAAMARLLRLADDLAAVLPGGEEAVVLAASEHPEVGALRLYADEIEELGARAAEAKAFVESVV